MPDETLTGVLERIRFYNEENHYTIGELRAKVKGREVLVSIVGSMAGVQCGETLSLSGNWEQNKTYGAQFKIKTFSSKLPADLYGIQKYLGSGQIHGIGPKFAEKIVAHFGTDTLRIISEDSGRLREVPGIGAKRAKEIKSSWEEQVTLREVMMFLQTYGVSTALCLRLIQKYGTAAKRVMENEPYRVAREVKGIGFKTADRIALNLGFSNEGNARIEAGILHALSEFEDEGHSAVPADALCAEAVELLEITPDKVSPCIDSLIQSAWLIDTCGRGSGSIELSRSDAPLQSPELDRAERGIADSIAQLLACPSRLPPILVDKAILWAQDKAGFEFAPEQAQAVSTALTHKVSILTGGPGTGKTTILRALVDILKAKKVRICLAAPTGRAAQRMSASARSYAQTVHRLLGFDHVHGGFVHNSEKPLSTDFIIVDESSMLDTRLAASLLRAVPRHAHLLLVGDVNQLPSVGSGNVLADIITFARQGGGKDRGIAVTALEQIFRQGKRSGIAITAHEILHGKAAAPFIKNAPDEIDPRMDFHFLNAPEPERCQELILDLYRRWIPKWYRKASPVMDAQVLAPMHRGSAGIGNLNDILQKSLNGKSSAISFGLQKFALGDKVIQMRNNYDLNAFNGDLGQVCAINHEAGTVAVQFTGHSSVVDYERSDMIDLSLAYAISIHKSQGSEFPIVIIPLLKQHFVMLQRNLLYTAITRGRRKVFVVGDPAAYSMAVRAKDGLQRISDLQQKLTVATDA